MQNYVCEECGEQYGSLAPSGEVEIEIEPGPGCRRDPAVRYATMKYDPETRHLALRAPCGHLIFDGPCDTPPNADDDARRERGIAWLKANRSTR